MDTLLSRVTLPAPESLVEAETVAALKDYARYLAASGMDPKEADWQKLGQDARPGAERRVREYLLLDEIARREGIEVSDTEVGSRVQARRREARRGPGGPARADVEERRPRSSARRNPALQGRGPADFLSQPPASYGGV